MPYRADLTYEYDGTFEGLLCCIFESYARNEVPAGIISAEAGQYVLFDTRRIETDYGKADRVYNAIPLKISPKAQELVHLGWLTCAPEKEMLILRFLRLGFASGSRVMDMLADNAVDPLNKAVTRLTAESHHYMGFVRFSVYGQALVAVIEPKNAVLPMLEEHFCDRYCNEIFMIHDKTHGMALVHRPGESRIVEVDQLTLPAIDAAEAEYRHLWRRFYDSIAIKERMNLRCRRSHMPKRFWSQLTELREEEQVKAPNGASSKDILVPTNLKS